MQYYDVFVRRWWKEATSRGWPNNLEPDARGRKHYLARGVSYEEARRLCDQWNSTHRPGRYSRRAEFKSV